MQIEVKILRDSLSEDVVLMLRAENPGELIALTVLVRALEQGSGQLKIDRKEYDQNGAVSEVVFETAPEPDPAE